MIRIRDPIHGSIQITPAELSLVDNRVFQRLRGIKQLGFADQAFPGATHTRYAHSLGAMEVVSRMFDATFPVGAEAGSRGCVLGSGDRVRLRQIVRLAMLLHDLGHPPGSHSSESCMGPVAALGLPCFAGQERRASHEDYTVQLILRSELAEVLRRFEGADITPEDVCHLLVGCFPERAGSFVVEGVDYFPLLTQMVSGELDADRMDYLQRDSFFAGVNYGKFDQGWLLENVGWHVEGDRAFMAIDHRAVFAFEDFLLSRYHMFVSVYYHYVPVSFDWMLTRYYREAPGEFTLPTEAGAYAATDDVVLWSALRRSRNPWAMRIAARQAFRRLVELNAEHDGTRIEDLAAVLAEAGIEHFVSHDQGILSKYWRRNEGVVPIYVRNRALRQVRPIGSFSKVYERYAQPTRLTRLYCRPDQAERGRELLGSFMRA